MDVKRAANLIKKLSQVAPPIADHTEGQPVSVAPHMDNVKKDEIPNWDEPPSWDPGPAGGGTKPQNTNFMGPQKPSNYNSVIKLQEAIVNFAKVAGNTDFTSMKGSGKQQEGNQEYETPNPNFDDTKPVSPQNPKTIKNKEYLGGSDAFGKFIVNNFLGQSSPIGHQYLNVDVSGQQNREDASIPDVSLRGIIDTIRRVGTPGAEHQADGVWKERTNNAIKNIFALTYAISEAAKTMHLQLPGLDDTLVSDFKKLVPQKYTDVPPDEMAQRADQLTDMIQTVTLVFKSFRDFVLNNNKYSQYINQTNAFAKYKQRQEPKNGSEILTKDEKNLADTYKTPFNVPFKGRRGAINTNVFLSDLENMQSVSALMQKLGRDPNNADQVKFTLNEILHAIPEYTAG